MKKIYSILASSLFILSGCGDSIPIEGKNTATGYAVDNKLINLDYDCLKDGTSGITDVYGRFFCSENQSVRFRIGGLVLGEIFHVQENRLVFPQDILNQDRKSVGVASIQLAKFLQNIDADGNLDNGIQIPDSLKSIYGEGLFNPNMVSQYLNQASIGERINDKLAEEHLKKTMVKYGVYYYGYVPPVKEVEVVDPDCEVDPTAEGCKVEEIPVDCEANPTAEGCEEEEVPVDCEANPTAEGCEEEEVPVDCEITPEDPSCPSQELGLLKDGIGETGEYQRMLSEMYTGFSNIYPAYDLSVIIEDKSTNLGYMQTIASTYEVTDGFSSGSYTRTLTIDTYNSLSGNTATDVAMLKAVCEGEAYGAFNANRYYEIASIEGFSDMADSFHEVEISNRNGYTEVHNILVNAGSTDGCCQGTDETGCHPEYLNK